VKRPLPYLVAALVAVLFLSACGAGTDPQAATIGSSSISRADLEDELRVLADNEKFAEGIKSQQNIDITPKPHTLLPEISSQWLNLLLNQTIVDREFEQRGLKISPQQETKAKTDAEATFGGAEVFGDFPQWFQDEMTGRQARVIALQADLPGFTPSEATLREYFDKNLASTCITNQLVSHILVATEAEAQAVKAALDAGADFETLAQQQSTDTASAQTGGALWCTGSEEFVQVDKDFQNGVLATPVGTTSGPVQSPFGWHIIRSSPWTYENVRPIVEQRYTQQVENPLTRLLNKELRRADVWVDPRYGKAVETGGTVVIEPPKAPEPKVRPPDPTVPGIQTPTP
jgi:hypothetical protein